jgi:hypothetical protein
VTGSLLDITEALFGRYTGYSILPFLIVNEYRSNFNENTKPEFSSFRISHLNFLYIFDKEVKTEKVTISCMPRRLWNLMKKVFFKLFKRELFSNEISFFPFFKKYCDLNIKDLHDKLMILINYNSQPTIPFSVDFFLNIFVCHLDFSTISMWDTIKFTSEYFRSQLEDFFDDLTDISLASDMNSYFYSIRSLRLDLNDSSSSTLLIGLSLVSALTWNSGDSYQVTFRKQVEFRTRRVSKTISIRKKGAPGSTITIRLRFSCQ